MAEEEYDLWVETASMRDFMVNLPFWVITVVAAVGFFIVMPVLALIPVVLGLAYFGITWLKRVNSRYRLTSQRIIVERGIFSRQTDEIELYRVIDTKAYENFAERMVNLGNIDISSSDKTGHVVIDKVPGARAKREQIRNLSEKV